MNIYVISDQAALFATGVVATLWLVGKVLDWRKHREPKEHNEDSGRR